MTDFKVGDRVRHVGSEKHNIPPGLEGIVVGVTPAGIGEWGEGGSPNVEWPAPGTKFTTPEYVHVCFLDDGGEEYAMVWHEPVADGNFALVGEG